MASAPALRRTRLTEIARDDAVAAPLALLNLSLGDDAADASWDSAVPALDVARLADGLPLLQRRTLEVDAPRVGTLLQTLAGTVTRAGTAPARDTASRAGMVALDPVTLLEASVRQDTERIADLAAVADMDVELLAVLGQLLAVPVLRACGRRAAPLLFETKWDAGYCPVCAAWPVLAERRGLERRRYLRCGRCAAEWTYALTRCAYCGNNDHKSLGYLAPEAQREAHQAATCDACRGYLKSFATVSALAPDELVAYDLATLELDVAAMEHGYARPDERGFPLEVEVTGGHR